MAATIKMGVKNNLKTQNQAGSLASERRFPPLRVADGGKLRLGGQGPVFRRTADAGTVRLGGQGPAFRFAAIADKGVVRLGGQGPIFR